MKVWNVLRPFIDLVLAAINSVASALNHSIVTDKGHGASSGKSVIEFWISQPRSSSVTMAPELLQRQGNETANDHNGQAHDAGNDIIDV